MGSPIADRVFAGASDDRRADQPERDDNKRQHGGGRDRHQDGSVAGGSVTPSLPVFGLQAAQWKKCRHVAPTKNIIRTNWEVF
jgi:hypothetical protein